MAGYLFSLYLLKVTFREFFLFTNMHRSTQIFVTKQFSCPSAHQAKIAFNFSSWWRVSTLVILGCQIAYSNVIHCSSIISNEYVFFLDSNSFPSSNNLIYISIFQSSFVCNKIFFLRRLSFKTQFKIEYFSHIMDLKKCLEWTLTVKLIKNALRSKESSIFPYFAVKHKAY